MTVAEEPSGEIERQGSADHAGLGWTAGPSGSAPRGENRRRRKTKARAARLERTELIHTRIGGRRRSDGEVHGGDAEQTHRGEGQNRDADRRAASLTRGPRLAQRGEGEKAADKSVEGAGQPIHNSPRNRPAERLDGGILGIGEHQSSVERSRGFLIEFAALMNWERSIV